MGISPYHYCDHFSRMLVVFVYLLLADLDMFPHTLKIFLAYECSYNVGLNYAVVPSLFYLAAKGNSSCSCYNVIEFGHDIYGAT